MLIIGDADFTHSGYNTVLDIANRLFISPEMLSPPIRSYTSLDPIWQYLPMNIKCDILSIVFDELLNSGCIYEAHSISNFSIDVFKAVSLKYREDMLEISPKQWNRVFSMLYQINSLQYAYNSDDEQEIDRAYGLKIRFNKGESPATNPKNYTVFQSYNFVISFPYDDNHDPDSYWRVKTARNNLYNIYIKVEIWGFLLKMRNIIHLYVTLK